MDIYVVGAGQHGEVVLDIARASGRYNVVGFFDSNPAVHGRELDGVPVLGPPERVDGPFVVAIGDNAARRRITEALVGRGLKPITVVHPMACVSPLARIGPGAMICAGAIVCIRTEVGAGVIINTGAVVDHHNRIGDFVHIGPRAVIAGRVTIGEEVLIGAGATVIPGLTVGAWSKVGAGSVVIHDVPPGITVVGVPGRVVGQKRSG